MKTPQEIDVKAVVSKLLADEDLVDVLFTGPTAIKQLDALCALPGIYMVALTGFNGIYSLKQVVYVGMSSNIRARFASHHKMPSFKKLDEAVDALNICHNQQPDLSKLEKRWDLSKLENLSHVTIHAWYNPLATIAQLYEIEAELIRTIKPIFNDRMPPIMLEDLPAILPQT